MTIAMYRLPFRPLRRVATALALTALLGALPWSDARAQSGAAERAELERLRGSIEQMIEALVDSKVLTRERADAILAQAGGRAVVSPAPGATGATGAVAAGATTGAVAGTVATAAAGSAEAASRGAAAAGDAAAAKREPVRVQYVPESVKRAMRDEIRQEVLAQAKAERWGDPGAMPDWLSRISLSGEVRVRMQRDAFANDNAPPSVLYDDTFFPGTNYADLTNSGTDRQRLRLRARLAANASLGEDWAAGVRLSTGNTLGPVSTSSTSGDPSDRYGVKMDRAFLRWSPRETIDLQAGRFDNPYRGTDLMFAPELGFDGAAASWRPTITDTLSATATAGAFVLRENALAKDRWMSGLQAGVNWRPAAKTAVRVSYGRFTYHNVEGTADTTNYGTPSYALTEYEKGFRQKGNSLFRLNDPVNDPSSKTIWGLVSKFDVNALSAAVELRHFDPIAITLAAEWLRNDGYDSAEIAQRLNGRTVTQGTNGRALRLIVGHPLVERRHQWQASMGWRYLEKDATLDAFTDPDFGVGGTNLRGYTLGLSYGLDRNVAAAMRWLSARQIEGPRFAVDSLLLDVTMRY